MTNEQFDSEMNYRAALAVAKGLLRQGLITEREFCRIDTMLIGIYRPIIGGLCSGKALI